MTSEFLAARWVDLLLCTWEVPDNLLAPHLPRGLTLDRWDGSTLVSLVAFDFLDTRVFGCRWPGLVDFPELNLRFYVRQGERRGVCFLREYVPSRIIASAARLMYNEPYRSAAYAKEGCDHVLRVGGRAHRISWTRSGEPTTPATDSLAHFLKEHEWGFGRTRGGDSICYRVHHPIWRVWPEVSPKIDVDFPLLYGKEWAFLGETKPRSVILAEGSEIAVYRAEPMPGRLGT